MKCYLVEAYSQDLKFKNDDYVVALTPLAVYQLDKACIGYDSVEDYYDGVDILKEEEAYYKDQLSWFDTFDTMLFDIFPEAKTRNIKLATVYYFYIKNMVDAVILRSRVIQNFITKIKPKTIIYISGPWKKEAISSSEYPLLFRKCQSLFSRLMPLFCKEHNIEFHHTIIKDPSDVSVPEHRTRNVMNRIKNSASRNQSIKTLWCSYKTFNMSDVIPFALNESKGNILFLKTNSVITKILKEARKAGYGIFYKINNDIFQQSHLLPRLVKNICTDGNPAPEAGVNNFRLDSESDIIKWVNGYCGVDVSSIIMPRLHYFLNEFCPQFLFLLDKYIALYNEHQIRLVFTPHMIKVDEFAAIAAAKYSRKTKSVCLQHGDDALDIKMWDLSEYAPYDIYFTNSSERERYIKNRINLGGFGTEVYQYRELFEDLCKTSTLRSKNLNRKRKKILVYVPTMYQWDNRNWKEFQLPDIWYFKWQKELVKFFSSRTDFNFIWKAFSPGETCDPSPQVINESAGNNITYATTPFHQFLDTADLVLFDLPSTALYEAALGGLPVLSLYFAPYTIVRESALSIFDKSLQPFYNFADGLSKVEKFLNADPDEFIVSIPHSEASVVETLPQLNTGAGKS